ncbi:TetR/AcrR family transcriptional regulator [Herbiconiux sp. CPCC 205763]|uniref:TetR/AcrR family transcriptional regulator n=1 Tax=Herbiconiux aconitum TaxID=2970913 RepID=A0ABT2GQ16_9MICO|nr:TetR/AcrR family transcriptional regulator [Herbiconiux aconitum]MCS5718303.1 TetR/AcrR family transcriptional regulator [Herbiconiux aconitum]
MSSTDELAENGTRRAPALPLEDRRAMILDAVIPLLVEQGADITSKQMAEAAGIAEGTVFRAFGDKDSLIRAAAEKFFDPEYVRNGLRGIDPDDPLESKIAQVIDIFRARLRGVMRVMAALGRHEPPPRPEEDRSGEIMAQVFAPDAERLALSPRRITHFIRLIAFSSAIPQINEVDTPFTSEELARIIVHGITKEASA